MTCLRSGSEFESNKYHVKPLSKTNQGEEIDFEQIGQTSSYSEYIEVMLIYSCSRVQRFLVYKFIMVNQAKTKTKMIKIETSENEI